MILICVIFLCGNGLMNCEMRAHHTRTQIHIYAKSLLPIKLPLFFVLFLLLNCCPIIIEIFVSYLLSIWKVMRQNIVEAIIRR